MDDNEITAIVGWPTEPEMARYRKVAAAAVAAERERCAAAVDHILREGGGTWGDWLRAGCRSPCCAGGPQWGRAWDCKKCPD